MRARRGAKFKIAHRAGVVGAGAFARQSVGLHCVLRNVAVAGSRTLEERLAPGHAFGRAPEHGTPRRVRNTHRCHH